MEQILTQGFVENFFFAVLRMSTPLIFCAMGALISRHAGTINLAMEGILLTAGLLGVIFSAITQSLLIGALGAIAGGVLISLVMGYMNIIIDANLMLTGVSLNQFASGGTLFLLFAITGDMGSSRMLRSLTFPRIDLPLIQDIPFIGPVFSGHNILTYMAFILAFVTWFFVFRTKTGLRIRAIGFNPNAAASVGINVKRIKFSAFVYSGVFAALGGAFLAMGYLSFWAPDMTAGRGFIGIAATNLAEGNVLVSVLASIFFGFTDQLAITLQTLNLRPQLLQMIPYLSTVLGLVIISIIRQNRENKRRAERLH